MLMPVTYLETYVMCYYCVLLTIHLTHLALKQMYCPQIGYLPKFIAFLITLGIAATKPWHPTSPYTEAGCHLLTLWNVQSGPTYCSQPICISVCSSLGKNIQSKRNRESVYWRIDEKCKSLKQNSTYIVK